MTSNTALVVGVTGIVGIPLAQQLLDKKWKVYGISRRSTDYIPSGVKHIALDVTKKEDCEEKLKELTDVTHVFFVLWVNCGREKELCTVNKKLIGDVLESLPGKLKHVALQTGTKHYFGSFDDMAERFQNPNIAEELSVPFKESLPRLPSINFYYDQEHVIFDMAAKRGFTWSVARPGIIAGFATNTEYNAVSNIAVFASICKHLNLPFTFPGGAKNYKRQIFWDASDADLIAEHLIWEATTKEAANQAFNVANGDVFTWGKLWQHFAEYFGLKVALSDELQSIQEFMKDKKKVWDDIVKKHGLKKLKLFELVKFDAVAGFAAIEISILSDMTKSRELGFKSYISTEKSFTKVFDYLRQNKYIP